MSDTVLDTIRVVTVNVALVAPAATSTVAGTVVSLPPVSNTEAPPDGAAAVRVAVAIITLPPTTVAALNEMDDSTAAATAAGGATTGAGVATAAGAVGEAPHCTMINDAQSVPTSEATTDRVGPANGYFLSLVIRS